MGKVTHEKFERIFKVKLKPPLSRKDKKRALRINQLFDAMRDELGMSEKGVFNAYANQLLSTFLNNVLDIHPGVEEFCRKALTPGTEERNRIDIARKVSDSGKKKT